MYSSSKDYPQRATVDVDTLSTVCALLGWRLLLKETPTRDLDIIYLAMVHVTLVGVSPTYIQYILVTKCEYE